MENASDACFYVTNILWVELEFWILKNSLICVSIYFEWYVDSGNDIT